MICYTSVLIIVFVSTDFSIIMFYRYRHDMIPFHRKSGCILLVEQLPFPFQSIPNPNCIGRCLGTRVLISNQHITLYLLYFTRSSNPQVPFVGCIAPVTNALIFNREPTRSTHCNTVWSLYRATETLIDNLRVLIPMGFYSIELLPACSCFSFLVSSFLTITALDLPSSVSPES